MDNYNLANKMTIETRRSYKFTEALAHVGGLQSILILVLAFII